MNYRYLGKTNLNVSVIGIGGGVFNRSKDASITLDKTKKIINFAVKNGINFIDMSKDYNEEFISKAMEDVRGKLYVITRSESRNAEEIENDIKDSIKKLKVKPDIYEITINSVEDLRNRIKEGVIDVLKEAKLNGKIKFTGIFSHKIEVLKEAIKTNEFDVVMTLYNAAHRKAEEIFPLKKKYNFGFIAAAPFATGILVDPKYDENVHMPGSEFMTAENSLKFILSSKCVDATVIGMKNFSHIQEDVKIGNNDWKLKEMERNEIVKRVENFLEKDFCRMCRYCEGCQQEIPIADTLKLLTLDTRYRYIDFAKWQYDSQKGKISKCTGCKLCEIACPYNLPIIKLLQKANETLG